MAPINSFFTLPELIEEISYNRLEEQKEAVTDDLPESSKGLLELARVELLVAIEVHASEDDFEGAEANTTLLLDSQLELEVQLADHNVLIHTVEGHGDDSCTK